jgi:hypothetical protein
VLLEQLQRKAIQTAFQLGRDGMRATYVRIGARVAGSSDVLHERRPCSQGAHSNEGTLPEIAVHGSGAMRGVGPTLAVSEPIDLMAGWFDSCQAPKQGVSALSVSGLTSEARTILQLSRRLRIEQNDRLVCVIKHEAARGLLSARHRLLRGGRHAGLT